MTEHTQHSSEGGDGLPDDASMHEELEDYKLEDVARMVASGARQSEIAVHFNVTERSVRRWVSRPEVAVRIRELERERNRLFIAGIQVRTNERALPVIDQLLNSSRVGNRVAAARLLLNASLRLAARPNDEDERLAAVEQAVLELKNAQVDNGTI